MAELAGIGLLGGLVGLFISLIVFVIFVFVIPVRLNKLISNQWKTNQMLSQLINAESLKGISKGYLSSRQCVKCNNVHVPELLKPSERCPNCGLSYKEGNIIVKRKNKIVSMEKDYFEKVKDKSEYEILLEL